MAQEIRHSLKILILVVSVGIIALGQSHPGAVDKSAVLSVPPGVSLAPGRYEAIIDVHGRRVPAQITLPGTSPSEPTTTSHDRSAPTTEYTPLEPSSRPVSAQASSPTEQARAQWVSMAVSAVGTLMLLCAAALIYFKLIQPRTHLKPYNRALELLEASKYEEALPILTEVESKLPAALRRDARFFIAFASMQMKNTQDAQHVLTALHREDPHDAHAAYLLAYILIDAKHYDEAEPVLEAMEANRQLNTRDAKRLLGVVKFQRGIEALRQGRVDGAVELFEKVTALGDFADQIPADVRDRHLVLGTKALFDGRGETGDSLEALARAREQFENLQKGALELPAAQRDIMLGKAKLGLALAAWVEDTPEGHTSVESLLLDAARLFDSQGPVELPWPDSESDPHEDSAENIKEVLRQADAAKDLSDEQKDVNLCLRDLHFLRGMAVLREWLRMGGKEAHEQTAKQLDICLSRFACARARDEQFSDVFLVVGLLRFYLQPPGPERRSTVNLLEQARKLGTSNPDALEIVNNRERIQKADADAVDKYQQVLDRYLKDETVAKEVRRDLLNRLSTNKRLMSRYKPPDLMRARTVPPTVQEVYSRSEILLVRVRDALRSSGNTEAQSLSEALQQCCKQLSEDAQKIERMESSLLAVAGDQLFHD